MLRREQRRPGRQRSSILYRGRSNGGWGGGGDRLSIEGGAAEAGEGRARHVRAKEGATEAEEVEELGFLLREEQWRPWEVELSTFTPKREYRKSGRRRSWAPCRGRSGEDRGGRGARRDKLCRGVSNEGRGRRRTSSTISRKKSPNFTFFKRQLKTIKKKKKLTPSTPPQQVGWGYPGVSVVPRGKIFPRPKAGQGGGSSTSEGICTCSTAELAEKSCRKGQQIGEEGTQKQTSHESRSSTHPCAGLGTEGGVRPIGPSRPSKAKRLWHSRHVSSASANRLPSTLQLLNAQGSQRQFPNTAPAARTGFVLTEQIRSGGSCSSPQSPKYPSTGHRADSAPDNL
ncbi:hypothetical protein Taro_003880, partial [Colocasia esculenta]|nr:hypothetical protein [Colocasia esculenta]